MNNAKPLVSIIIPVYNGSNYMREAIDSALAQTYGNIEVIVVNDGSKDDTDEIARSYGDRIRYFSKENGGVSSALNLGIREMKGEYFSWLSHDDKYEPDKIGFQIEQLQKYGDERTLSYCGTKQIDKNGALLRDVKVNRRLKTDRKHSWEESLSALIRSGSFSGCALLIPKAAFDEAGGFHEGLRYSQDFLMWMMIFLKKFGLVYAPKGCVMSRIHPGQLSRTGGEIFHKDCATIYDLLRDDVIEASHGKYNFLYLLGKKFAKYNNPEIVKKCIADGKEKKRLSAFEILRLRTVNLYGYVRPAIKKVYYRLFKKVK